MKAKDLAEVLMRSPDSAVVLFDNETGASEEVVGVEEVHQGFFRSDKAFATDMELGRGFWEQPSQSLSSSFGDPVQSRVAIAVVSDPRKGSADIRGVDD